MDTLAPFNFKRWIDDHRHLLKPPVMNQVVWKDAEFIIMVVGGPNARTDFHIDPAEEFFYQLEGDMTVRVVDDGQIKDLAIREGDIMLLPPLVPHNPIRKANTVGLVVERKRRAGELDGLAWFCDRCAHKLYEERFPLKDITKDFPPVFDRFYASEKNRTCAKCSWVMPPRA